MGLWMAPFAGLTVGGGGHNSGDFNQSPPPSGAGANAGPARSRLRILGQDGKQLKKRFIKVVPPGQFPSLSPPYEWEPHERKDWKYPQSETNGTYPKRPKTEGRFVSRALLVELKFPRTEDPIKRAISDKVNQASVITNKIQELTRQAGEIMQRYRQQKATAMKQAQVVKHGGQFESTHWVGLPMRSTLRLIRTEDDDAPLGLEDPSGAQDRPIRSAAHKPTPIPAWRGPAFTERGWLHKVTRPRDHNAAPHGLSRQPAGSPQLATALSGAEALKKQADDIHEKQIPPLRAQVEKIHADIVRLRAQKASKPAQPAQHSQPTRSLAHTE